MSDPGEMLERHWEQLRREYTELSVKSQETRAALWRARDELQEMQQRLANMPLCMRRGHMAPNESLRRQRGSSSIVPGVRHLEEESGIYNRMMVYTRLLQEQVRQKEKENKEAHDLLHNKQEELDSCHTAIINSLSQHTESDPELDSEYFHGEDSEPRQLGRRARRAQRRRQQESTRRYSVVDTESERRQLGARFFVHAIESMA